MINAACCQYRSPSSHTKEVKFLKNPKVWVALWRQQVGVAPSAGYSSLIFHGHFPSCHHSVIFIHSSPFLSAFIKPFPGILRHAQIYCAAIPDESAFISLNMSAAVFTNNAETLFLFFWATDANHAGQQSKDTHARSKWPWATKPASGHPRCQRAPS